MSDMTILGIVPLHETHIALHAVGWLPHSQSTILPYGQRKEAGRGIGEWIYMYSPYESVVPRGYSSIMPPQRSLIEIVERKMDGLHDLNPWAPA